MLQVMENILEILVRWGILLFEFIGVLVIIRTGIVSVYMGIRKLHGKRIYLAKGLSLGLQFKMGSEILRTVLIREWTEIGIIAGIIVLRAAIAVMIHWEMKHNTEADEMIERAKKRDRKTHEISDDD